LFSSSFNPKQACLSCWGEAWTRDLTNGLSESVKIALRPWPGWLRKPTIPCSSQLSNQLVIDRSSFWKASSYKQVSPARQGETLAGQFKTISSSGNTALGGDAMVVASANISFASNGQFTLAKSGGGSAGNWAGSSQSHETGTYRLENYMIELKCRNGNTERRFFYFYPDSRQHFGIGKSAYLPIKGE
jgi:hypothetical protein